MKFDQFEDIIAWQKSKELVIHTYKVFDSLRDFSFRDQARRAAISVMNNIAEGFERKSNKEFKQFLFISKGSCGELRSMLVIAKELGYISPKSYNILYDRCLEISRMISGLIKTL